MRYRRGARVVPMFLLHCLLLVTIQPVVLAESAWEEDGWLNTSIALDRVEMGDEIGCYGMPGLSWYNDPGAVAQTCRDYIENRLPASKWGDSPISTFTPTGLTMAQHTTIKNQGFTVHGDNTGLSVTAWHDADDQPDDLWDWFNLGRRGGSLELGIADLSSLQQAVADGGLVNMYWVGRINDATVRHDNEVVEFLTSSETTWLTTWGEVWSAWSAKRCFEFEHTMANSENGSVLTFRPLLTPQCTSVQDGRTWNVPVTWVVDVEGQDVHRVTDGQGDMVNIQGEQNTMEGWWQDDSGSVFLSVVNNQTVQIHLNNTTVQHDILGQTAWWNNHSAAVTVAGHDTTDMFRWSKRFNDDPELRFTWLVTPKPADEGGAWMTYAVVGVALVSVLAMLGILAREGVGPLAGRWPGAESTRAISSPIGDDGRSLDGEDE
ncbi:MAG: hypothetical protein DWC07_06930 [Candidatus Poseidoniales archaeon]|nr:MAG: hypothetical protein DWC07_06930 [Candidatus Poseidoniales archaeon]